MTRLIAGCSRYSQSLQGDLYRVICVQWIRFLTSGSCLSLDGMSFVISQWYAPALSSAHSYSHNSQSSAFLVSWPMQAILTGGTVLSISIDPNLGGACEVEGGWSPLILSAGTSAYQPTVHPNLSSPFQRHASYMNPSITPPHLAQILPCRIVEQTLPTHP